MPTITDVQKGKTLEPAGDRPELVVWNVKVDNNGESVDAELLRRPDSPAPTGDVTLQQTQHGWKAKLVQQGFAGGGKSYEADPKGLRGKNASMAVAYAKDLVVAEKIQLDQLSLYAERFYGFIEKKARVDG